MRRGAAMLALALLAGCHRPRADQPAPGADGEAQARTAAKTLADLAAADQASRGPVPVIQPVAHAPAVVDVRPRPAAVAPADDAATDVPEEPGNAGGEA